MNYLYVKPSELYLALRKYSKELQLLLALLLAIIFRPVVLNWGEFGQQGDIFGYHNWHVAGTGQ